jgi:CelD/BcsL family acetyltransferase involved in cellulose biosynthesis
MLRIVVVTRQEEVVPHVPAWDELACSVARPMPTSAYPWVASRLEVGHDAGRPWICFFAYRGDRLTGVLSVVRRAGAGTLWRPRLAAFNRFNARQGPPLVADDEAGETLAALLEGVRRNVPRFQSLDLGSVVEGTAALEWFRAQAASGGLVAEPETTGSSFPVRGVSRDAWWGGLSKNLRSDLKRGEKRWAEETGGSPAVRFLSGGDASPGLLDRYVELEAAGWKGREGTALACKEEDVRLWRDVVARLAERRWLEWHVLEREGRPAAMHLAARMGKSLLLLKLAYDEALAKSSPGALLLARTVERELADARSDEVNFTTHYPWLDRWRTRVEAYHRVRVFGPGFAPRVLGSGSERLRRGLKRIRWLRRVVRRARGEAPA